MKLAIKMTREQNQALWRHVKSLPKDQRRVSWQLFSNVIRNGGMTFDEALRTNPGHFFKPNLE